MVSAIAWALMDHASQSTERGCVSDFDIETYAVFSGFEEDVIASVMKAMVDKAVIVNGYLAAWDKRQPKVADGTAAERQKRWREKKRQERNEGDDRDEDVTERNALRDGDVTGNEADKRRGDKSLPASTEESSSGSVVRTRGRPRLAYPDDDDHPFADREVA